MPKLSKPTVSRDQLTTPRDTIRVESSDWFTWLAAKANISFIYEGQSGRYNARREERRGSLYWYAYRRRGGKLTKAYVGKAEELTLNRLEEISTQMAGENLLQGLDTETQPSNPSLHLDLGSELSYFSLSKVRAPAMPQHFVRRPRLTQRINSAITLIYAPSGYGKSTVINEWFQTCGRPVAWVTLDADDNHPVRFWTTIVTALQALPPLQQILRPYLRIASASEISESLAQLSDDIARLDSASGATQGFGLVLDDYHHIQHRQINATLQAWLQQTMPPNLQVVIAGHTRPRLALGHLRAQRQVIELDTEDLRFTLGEGIDFLWQHTREQPLAYGDMETLVQRTEGWAAGLSLATLALTKQIDRRQFIEQFNGNHAYLNEFFMESVLSRQPTPVQAFLIKTAILKHLYGPLCEAVTGQVDGAGMLARLWESNLFIVRSAQEDWYRYHDLFAETLRGHLQRRFPADVPQLHRRAAEWYRDQNAPAEAVFHLLAIEAWEEAAALIEEMARRELEQYGEDSRLLRWLLQMPESVVQRHSSLLSVYIRLVVMALSPQEAERILARAEADLASRPANAQTSDEQAVLAQIQTLRSAWAADETPMTHLLRGSPNDDLWQMLADVGHYDNIWRRSLTESAKLAGELYEAARTRRHLFIMLMSGGTWADRVAADGHLHQAEKIAQRVLRETLERRGKLPEPASIALCALGRVYYEYNQLTQAEQFIQRASEVDPNPTSSNMPITIAILRARILSAQGKGEAALATLAAARALQARRPAGSWRERDLIAYQAFIYARNGNAAQAEQIVNETGERETQPLVMLVWAEVLLQQARWPEAEVTLQTLLAWQPDGFHDEQALRMQVMLALVLFQRQKLNEACTLMADIVRVAAPEAFIRPFLDYGQLCGPLLTLVKHRESLTAEAQAFVKDILRQVGGAPGAPSALPQAALQGLTTAASISTRELEVLRLACAGLSVVRIAASLSVSTSTVKTHLQNIYRKLEVRNRAQAIVKAQALQLV
jgi:LuxR family transcriptional regulator, maltose regulon positive regulatory protein